MKQQYPVKIKRLVAVALSLPILFYGIALCLRPAGSTAPTSLFPGIAYRRDAQSAPRPAMIHVVEIDLATVRPLVSPADETGDKAETSAIVTSEFVKSSGVQLAVNANFFFPFKEALPWDFYPQRRDRTNVVGQAISDSKPYSLPESRWTALCFLPNRAIVEETGNCPAETQQAVAGNELLVREGKPVEGTKETTKDKPYARTAVGVDSSGQKLWIVIVDGKQFRYSEGITIAELAAFMAQLGVQSAVNLDGGGSVTLAAQTQSGVKILNAPIHTRIPMRERPVAVHLGFFAK